MKGRPIRSGDSEGVPCSVMPCSASMKGRPIKSGDRMST